MVFGTSHALQGAQNYPGTSVDSPAYSKLLVQLISNRGIDFIFEEACGKGPTIASKVAGSIPYLDVDPGPEKYRQHDIPEESGSLGIQIDPDDARMSNDFYAWEYTRVQALREDFWLRMIQAQQFRSGLMICGYLHLLSFASRLALAKFDVESLYYMPHHRLCMHKT